MQEPASGGGGSEREPKPLKEWVGAKLRLPTTGDNRTKKRGVEYAWIHEWVIPAKEEGKPAGKGWTCKYCGKGQLQLFVERIRKHVVGCDEVSWMSVQWP
jgi:hypothetical protein